MDNQLRSDLDATRQRLQEAADQMDTVRADIQGKLRQRRWLRPAQERLRQFAPKRPPIWQPVIRGIRRLLRRPAPPAGPYARWIEKLDEIAKAVPHDPAQ